MSDFKDHPVLVAARNVQDRSQNLVVYSRLVKAIIQVSWVVRPDGQPLKATGLKEWLRLRGLFLECLCPLVHDVPSREPHSCRLVESSSSGDVFAFCNLEVDGCGMCVNISNVVETTHLFSNYGHFATIKGSAPNNCPAMATILGFFHKSGYPDMTVAPHLLGYIGEHIAFYQPGAKQLAGVPRSFGGRAAARKFVPRALSAIEIDKPLSKLLGKRRYIEFDEFDNPSSNPPSAAEAETFITPFGGRSRALTKIRRNRASTTTNTDEAAVAGSSQLSPISISSGSDNDDSANTPSEANGIAEAPVFKRLREGEGVTVHEWFDLVLLCTNCGKFFLTEKLAGHTVPCIARDAI